MRILLVLYAALVVTSSAEAAPIPIQVRGKTIMLSWNENRMQKWGGSEVSRAVGINAQMTIYVSSAGRVFRRITMSFASGKGSGTRDRVPNAQSSNSRFEGRSLILDSAFTSGARRIIIDFDNGFEGCQAKMIVGKESGRPLRQTGMITAVELEVDSITVGAVSCSMRDGNPFQR